MTARTFRALLPLIAAAVGALSIVLAAAPPPALVPHELVARLDARGTEPVPSRALRRLRAGARNGRLTATLDAWVTTTGSSMGFDVVREAGAGIIRTRVLRAALDAERALLASGAAAAGALSSANYEFTELSDAPDGMVQMSIRPRRPHHLLVAGRLSLDPSTAEVVALEGWLSKRPSFWTRRVHVTRTYRRVAGANLPASMTSTADVLLAGASWFEMTYCYAEVDGLIAEVCVE